VGKNLNQRKISLKFFKIKNLILQNGIKNSKNFENKHYLENDLYH